MVADFSAPGHQRHQVSTLRGHQQPWCWRLVRQVGVRLPWERISSTCVITVWRDTQKNKQIHINIFFFQMNRLITIWISLLQRRIDWVLLYKFFLSLWRHCDAKPYISRHAIVTSQSEDQFTGFFWHKRITILLNVIRGPFYWHGLTLILAYISNHSRYTVSDEITSPFPIFNGCTVEV